MDILLPAEKDRQGRHPEPGLLVVPVAVETVMTKLLQQQRRLWSMGITYLETTTVENGVTSVQRTKISGVGEE